MNLNKPSQTPISAFCSCKGGADGFCRYIIATLFEIESYVNDHNQWSVTSGPSPRIQKGNKSSQPLPVVDLQTDIAKHEIHHLHTEQQYNPVPENIPLPDLEQFMQILENHLLKSCMLDLHRVKVTNRTTSLPCKGKVSLHLQTLKNFAVALASQGQLLLLCQVHHLILIYYHGMWTLVSNLKERQSKCGWTHKGLNIMDAKSLSQACVLVQTQWWKTAMHINGMVFTNWYGNVSNTQHLQQGKQHKVCFV